MAANDELLPPLRDAVVGQANIGASRAVRLTLLARAYCHLCDEMQAAVAPVAAARGATLVLVDVDADPALDARYGDQVPVLFLGEPGSGLEIAHYVCDPARVDAALMASADLGGGATQRKIC